MPIINLLSVHPNPWLRQFPKGIPEWEGWKFVFNAVPEEGYDYLVVFDDLPAPIKVACLAKNIIHLATEPPSVHHYNKDFLQQFAWVITQDPNVKQAGAIHYQPGLTWFIGWQAGETDYAKIMNFEQLKATFTESKTKLISIIASNKVFTPEHKARLEFAQKLKEHYGDKIDFYGRGFVPMADKLDALKEYRFQVVLENSSHENYFSEKLSDCILAGTYPIYYGCTNLDKYFPKNTCLKIDINDFAGSVALIDKAIANSIDKKYASELLIARDKVLYEHNLFPMLIKLISRIERHEFGVANNNILYQDELLPFNSIKFKSLFTHNISWRMKIRKIITNSKCWLFIRGKFLSCLK